MRATASLRTTQCRVNLPSIPTIYDTMVTGNSLSICSPGMVPLPLFVLQHTHTLDMLFS
jgi:hypothetical protein